MFVIAVVEKHNIRTLILQGNGETHFSCGGKYFYRFVSNSLLILTENEFRNSVSVCQSYEHINLYSALFLTHSVHDLVKRANGY